MSTWLCWLTGKAHDRIPEHSVTKLKWTAGQDLLLHGEVRQSADIARRSPPAGCYCCKMILGNVIDDPGSTPDQSCAGLLDRIIYIWMN